MPLEVASTFARDVVSSTGLLPRIVSWLPAPLMLVRRNGEIVDANASARDVLGLGARTDEAPARFQDLLVDPQGEVQAHLRSCARTSGPLPFTVGLTSGDGEPQRLRCFGGVYRREGQESPALVLLQLQLLESGRGRFEALNRQIAELQRRLQQQRKDELARREFEERMFHSQKLESLGVLAGGIAHDFNNILASIMGYADLALADLPPNSKPARYLDDMLKGTRRASELTQQMLAYAGKGRFHVEPVDLSELVDDTRHLLGLSISKKVVLNFDLHQDLPRCQADPSQLRQIVMNLIINASEAIGDQSGVITISTGAAQFDQEYLEEAYLDDGLPSGLYATLEVADTGCGMSPETRSRIFEPFFTSKFTGRGLGLAAVLGIVRSHGGALRVYSELGKGTTFKILLPASSDFATRDDTPNASLNWRGSGTVLVVDDEESVRAITQEMLEHLGFEVLTASDGREALEVYRQHARSIRLVLLDLTMPHLDGEQTFRQMKRDDPGVRVVIMSGYSAGVTTNRFPGLGLAGVLQKPYQLRELIPVLQQALADPSPANTGPS